MRPRIAFTKAWSFPKHRAPKPLQPTSARNRFGIRRWTFPKKEPEFRLFSVSGILQTPIR